MPLLSVDPFFKLNYLLVRLTMTVGNTAQCTSNVASDALGAIDGSLKSLDFGGHLANIDSRQAACFTIEVIE